MLRVIFYNCVRANCDLERALILNQTEQQRWARPAIGGDGRECPAVRELRGGADACQAALATHAETVALGFGALLAAGCDHPILNRVAALQHAQFTQPAVGIVALRHRTALDRRLRATV